MRVDSKAKTIENIFYRLIIEKKKRKKEKGRSCSYSENI